MGLVSRRHCQIELLWNGVEIRDLESRNGTYVNGRRIGFPLDADAPDAPPAFKLPLKDGDEILVGNSVIRARLTQIPDGSPAQDATKFAAIGAGI
jgi:pSer/pThr/pTyr-binding forkhead associated (FHA) protein